MSTSNLLRFKVITPEGIMREIDNLTAVNVPLVNDYLIGIRPGHAPLIAETKQGKIICRTRTSEVHLELHGGVLEVENNEVIIFSAGEVTNRTSIHIHPPTTTYDRLMRTLIGEI